MKVFSRSISAVALILLLFLVQSGAADTGEPIVLSQGRVSLPAGDLYVPGGLTWFRSQQGETVTFQGFDQSEPPDLRLVLKNLEQASELEGGQALQLFREQMAECFESKLSSLEQKAASTAPYPWPDSLELQLQLPGQTTPLSAYIGSSSGHTVILCAIGEDSAELANRTAASFKPNLTVQRQSQVRQGSSERFQSMLGTAATFLMVFFTLVPIGITLFVNRRKKASHNPFRYALMGLGVGSFCAVAFNVMMLQRFSWAGLGDHGEALGGVIARAIFLGLIALYSLRKWHHNHVAEE